MKNKKAEEGSQSGLGIIIKWVLLMALFLLLFFGVRYLIKFLTVRGA
jgi:hypothetical protein